MPDETILPPETTVAYTQMLRGYFGRFGTGSDAQVIFLQSAITPRQLKDITLISDIPGSETWSVRDLFQRDVDTSRVEEKILPYFKDPEKVKFFNPLTLTALPIDPATHDIVIRPPGVDERRDRFDGREYDVLEAPDFYRFRHVPNAPYYGIFEWNTERVELVAIDGQHRLSALQRYQRDTDQPGEFASWTIPIVVFAVKPLVDPRRCRSILDVVRSVFIYINKEAKEPSRARQILLSDESPNHICTQEILEYAHENDVKPNGRRDPDRLPLLLFDWRGEEEGGKPVGSPAALLTAEEIDAWLEWYLLGDDFGEDQRAALGITPMDEIHKIFAEEKLPIQYAEEVRQRFRERVLGGVIYLLENFSPFAEYIAELRKLEDAWTAKSDSARHAFHKLRFGTHRGDETQLEQISDAYREIVQDMQAAAQGLIPDILRKDIGMRGIMSAFEQLAPYHSSTVGRTVGFEEHAKWFVPALNAAWASGWVDGRNDIAEDLLLHIVRDQNDNVINYRLGDAKDAFGAYLTVIVGAYGTASRDVPSKEVYWDELWEEASEALDGTLQKGHKRDLRAILKEHHPTKSDEYKRRLTEGAAKRTREQLERLREAAEGILG